MSLSLTITDLVARDPRGRILLSVDALSCEPGQAIGIRGPSGAGKSTLLMAIAGILAGAEGQVKWGDVDILTAGQSARTAFRASNIGLIFQDFLLFEELSPAANAAIAALFLPAKQRRGLRQRANEQLLRLNIPQDARTVASFSGGERQRVAIARALANDPAILLADEPTASLDRDTANRVADDLTRLARAGNKTLITVSHDHDLLSRMDRVLTLTDGRITNDSRQERAGV